MAKKTQKEVNYRQADFLAIQRCGTCSMFLPPGSCSHVEGDIRPGYVCDDYEPVEIQHSGA